MKTRNIMEIQKVGNGYVLSGKHLFEDYTKVYRTFDEAVQELAWYFREVKIGEIYTTKEDK